MGGPCLADVTLTESIEALLPKSGRETIPALPFFENSLDKVLDLDAIENEEPTELSLLTTALMQRFRKFELTEFNRSKSCKLFFFILTRFRNFNIKGGSLTVDDIRKIGFLTEKDLQ